MRTKPILFNAPPTPEPKVASLAATPRLLSRRKLDAVLTLADSDITTGRYRMLLYRFLADNLPVVHACLWTWVRLIDAPGGYTVDGDPNHQTRARDILDNLWNHAYTDILGNRIGLGALLPDLLTGLLRDGMFGGFVTVTPDGSAVDQFIPVDPVRLERQTVNKQPRLTLDAGERQIDLHRPDFYYLPFNNGVTEPFGRSLLQPIPFVAYIEQQLVDDMRRTSHNSGYHRLHVKLTPPERMSGEADEAYTNRINEYFDATVRMIRDCDVDENPVTWDNVLIEHVGPDKSKEVSNSWFMNHRAMIEDICAGTNLSPYLLGYSYGATTSWAEFKFDVVMRQVRSIQNDVARFLEWLGNIELALHGVSGRCRFRFDNSFAYQATDNLAVETGRIDNLLKLYQAGLIDEETARERVWKVL